MATALRPATTLDETRPELASREIRRRAFARLVRDMILCPSDFFAHLCAGAPLPWNDVRSICRGMRTKRLGQLNRLSYAMRALSATLRRRAEVHEFRGLARITAVAHREVA